MENLESGILPVGIMISREEFLRLREMSRKPGPLKKIADEMIAEAVAHLDYTPERYTGRYLPVDLGNQGCERRASPSDQMHHFSSCMVYGAVAYALTGDLRHGQTARRGLFSALSSVVSAPVVRSRSTRSRDVASTYASRQARMEYGG